MKTRSILVWMTFLVMFTTALSQVYQVTMRPRRAADQLYVEIWIKSLTSSAPKLGDASLVVRYNSSYLQPATTQAPSSTDSVHYNVTQANPIVTITSQFHGVNGYNNLATQAYGAPTDGLYSLEVRLATLGSGGVQPSSTGRGSFVGKLIFDIINTPDTTQDANFQWNTLTTLGDIRIFDVDGNDIESQVQFINPGSFRIVGITILNPNGPSEVVDRDASYLNNTLVGYPIYFERSGFAEDQVSYATNATAYVIELSLDGGNSWTEVGRVAETTSSTASLVSGGVLANHVSGEISTTASTHIISTYTGAPLTLSASTYRQPLRVVWATNPTLVARSEQARLRITQLDETGYNSNIVTRGRLTPFDISDADFVYGRIFFLQIAGSSSQEYFKTTKTFSTPTEFTVEAWVNLNEVVSGNPGIIASSPGPGAPEEGSWILYLKNGKFPAFRVREVLGRGANGYLADVVAYDSLIAVSDAIPLGNSHAANWRHLAAVVKNDTVRLFLDGEIAVEYVNTNAADIRPLPTDHPIWVGVDPNNTTSATIPAENYFHGGIKGIRIWRAALTQEEIRQRVAGIDNPTNTSGTANILKSLELYFTLEGSNVDLASESYYQNGSDTLIHYLAGSRSDNTIRFRPDLPHLRLTAPTGGEGISNRQNITFEVRWVGYGLNNGTNATVQIEYSLDNSTWSYASSATGTPLNSVLLGNGRTTWEPYESADLRNLAGGAYSAPIWVRIRGAVGGDTNVVFTSDPATVAPYFSLYKNKSDIVVVEDGGPFAITGNDFFIEAWIRPYRFPTAAEGYFPIVSKVDTARKYRYYSLRLLSTGQLEFRITDTAGVERIARSDSTKPLEKPLTVSTDSAWTHVGVYVNLGNGGQSDIRFYIDGVPQSADTTITNQLGSNLYVDISDTSDFYIGYEPKLGTGADTVDAGFIGEIREIRFWKGAPNSESTAGAEPTSMTKFVWGAQAVYAKDLTSSYNANLVAAFDFNGGSFINNSVNRNFNRSFASSNNKVIARFYGVDSLKFVANEPYIKVVEPVFKQQVVNTTGSTVRVRWVGFHYTGATGVTSGSPGVPPSLEFSIRGGGGMLIQPYQYVGSTYWHTTQTIAFTLPSTSEYQFNGTGAPVQFAGSLDAGLTDPDLNDDGVYTDQGPIAAALTNARLRLSVTTATVIDTVRAESPLFTVVPRGNFTVRVLLEGYHIGTGANIQANLASTFESGGLVIKLYKDNAGSPGQFMDSALSVNGYSDLNPANRNAGNNKYANVPVLFTTIPEGNYWAVVDHINHLPVMSRLPAPFRISGDNEATWDIESGWDFQTWNGTAGNVLPSTWANITITTVPSSAWQTAGYYTAYGPAETSPTATYYSNTGLIYNNGRTGVIGAVDAIASMVAGDVERDGQINAADRVRVRLDAGTNLVRSDVTGDGQVNATDRTIVDRNFGKVSSIYDVTFPTGIRPADYDPLTVIAREDPWRSEWFNANYQRFASAVLTQEVGPVRKGIRLGNYVLSGGGIEYRVLAVPRLVGNYVEVDVYIQNEGEPFALGNATFALQYDPTKLQFMNLYNTNGSPFHNKPQRGYAQTYSAPKPGADKPLPNVRTIEIDYDQYARRPGSLVPDSPTLLGTLRFLIKERSGIITFEWYESTVVHTTDGANVTDQGIFETIKPIFFFTAEVVVPNGGEQWRPNRPYRVKWIHTGEESIRLQYSVDGGETWYNVVDQALDPATGELLWTVPAGIESNRCLVRILDDFTGIELDRSDDYFSIVSAYARILKPSADDPVYFGGSTAQILWEAKGLDQVQFDFSPDAGKTWEVNTSILSASAKNAYWRVPFVNTRHAQIRMVEVLPDGSREVMAVSEEFRVLAGRFTFTYPRKDVSLKVGQVARVRWTIQNAVEYVDIQLSTDNGETWTTVMANVDASRRYVDWVVPPMEGTKTVILRAIYPGEPALEYDRTDPFIIQGTTNVPEAQHYGDITLYQPHPQPAHDQLVVRYELPEPVPVVIRLLNVVGRQVAKVATRELSTAGTHRITLDVSMLPAGSYTLELQAGNKRYYQRVVIVR